MEWSRSETIGLAKASCTHCQGDGMRCAGRSFEHPCGCVFRAIFRACYTRFRECIANQQHLSTVSLDSAGACTGKRAYGRKVEEYLADFCAVSRRGLDDSDYQLFRDHFLLGADWNLCCRRRQIDRGTFFHEMYRIQEILGRTYRELQPYSLFPLDEYFGGTVRKSPPVPFLMETKEFSKPTFLRIA